MLMYVWTLLGAAEGGSGGGGGGGANADFFSASSTLFLNSFLLSFLSFSLFITFRKQLLHVNLLLEAEASLKLHKINFCINKIIPP